MIFACCLKTYLDFSSRRSESDIQLSQELGYIDHVPHFNTILKYLRKPEMKTVLTKLIKLSALPLKEVEENFAMDASGFSTAMICNWNKCKAIHNEKRKFKKAHIMVGVRTNVIAHIEVSDGYLSDGLMFETLLRHTAQHFDMKEVYADKAYLSEKNLDISSQYGVIPFIPFRKNTRSDCEDKMMIWRIMYRYFKNNKEEWMKHYHLRSNAETAFSMMKRKFGVFVRGRTDTARENEVLCKALCHNICVLIQEMFELGIKVDFQEVMPKGFMCKITP